MLQMRKGFTVIELLLVLAIALLLAAGTAPLYTNLQVSAQLNENTSQIIQTLRTARQRSAAGYNNAVHGVYVEINADAQDKLILFQGSSYAARDENLDRTVTLDEALSLSTTLTSSQVTFTKGVGRANGTGTITLTHDVHGSRVVGVNELGVVEEE